jgi:dihydrofolate reductase
MFAVMFAGTKNMRKIIAEIAVSLDGYIEGPAGELDWLLFDERPSGVQEFFSRFDVIFYGRVAYERLGAYLNDKVCAPDCRIRKYVFSNTLKHVGGNGMVIGKNLLEKVKEIKEEEGKDIWLCGGAEIIQTFSALDLVDEYVLAVHPVVLGTGKSLFKKEKNRMYLKLQAAQYLDTGVVILTYINDFCRNVNV